MKIYRTTKISKQTGAVMWQRYAANRKQYAAATSDGGAWRFRITLEVAEIDEAVFRVIEGLEVEYE